MRWRGKRGGVIDSKGGSMPAANKFLYVFGLPKELNKMEEMKPRPKQSTDNAGQAPASEIISAKHMVVGIDRRLFALPVENVREIVRMPPWVNVPKKPDHIRGMINLRGKIIRLVDTRKFLGMKSKIEELVSCHACSVGYNRLNFLRASSVVNCQLILAF